MQLLFYWHMITYLISTGSAETLFRWGGNINQLSIAQSLTNSPAKNIKIRQSLFKLQLKMSGSFFGTQCTAESGRPKALTVWCLDTSVCLSVPSFFLTLMRLMQQCHCSSVVYRLTPCCVLSFAFCPSRRWTRRLEKSIIQGLTTQPV